ncbi:MAG: ABC transporter substrate-binding protein, partial [Desulfurococcaceae archaeon]
MKAISKWLVVTIVVIVIVAATSVIAFLFWQQPPAVPKKVIVYASLSEMTSAEPSTEFSNSVMWLPLVYETLVWYDPFKDQFIPALAERWESNPESTEWTFYIRRNAKFHDGSPVNAEAVAFSINRT